MGFDSTICHHLSLNDYTRVGPVAEIGGYKFIVLSYIISFTFVLLYE